jgi:hypothetical protein
VTCINARGDEDLLGRDRLAGSQF